MCLKLSAKFPQTFSKHSANIPQNFLTQQNVFLQFSATFPQICHKNFRKDPFANDPLLSEQLLVLQLHQRTANARGKAWREGKLVEQKPPVINICKPSLPLGRFSVNAFWGKPKVSPPFLGSPLFYKAPPRHFSLQNVN